MLLKTTNGTIDQYPYTVGQLRRDNPQTSFPKRIPDEMLAELGVLPVTVQDRPTIDDRTQKAAQASTPVLTNGSWVLTWSVTSKTAEEVQQYDENKAASVRAKRNALLAETDWRFRSDLTASQAWIDYCQALRDITDHANFPYLADTDWPVKP